MQATLDANSLFSSAPAHHANPVRASAAHAVVESAELLRGQKTVEIKHNGSVYRLQATKLGKLILTK